MNAQPLPTLFVAPDLSHFDSLYGEVYADDVTIDGRVYRRLDGPYYAWLRHKMELAQRAVAAGRFPRTTFDAMRARFNAVHEAAVARLGGPALAAAVRSFDPHRYDPPEPDDDLLGTGARTPKRPPRGPIIFTHPPGGDWPFTEVVAACAVAKVTAIRDEALALGWSEDALLRNRGSLRFPYGGEWGLVCFLDGDAAIADVTREAITIQRPRGATHRFPNPDVEQPWRRRVGAAGGVA